MYPKLCTVRGCINDMMGVRFQKNWSTKQMLLTKKILQYLSLKPILDVLTTMFWEPGGRLNKKDGLTRYGDSHVKDKTS